MMHNNINSHGISAVAVLQYLFIKKRDIFVTPFVVLQRYFITIFHKLPMHKNILFLHLPSYA